MNWVELNSVQHTPKGYLLAGQSGEEVLHQLNLDSLGANDVPGERHGFGALAVLAIMGFAGRRSALA